VVIGLLLKNPKGVVVLAKHNYFIDVIKLLSETNLTEIFNIDNGKFELKLTELDFPELNDSERGVSAEKIKLYFFIFSLTEEMKYCTEIKGEKITFNDDIQSLAEDLGENLEMRWPNQQTFLEFILKQGSWKYVLFTTLLFHKGIIYVDGQLQAALTQSIFQNDKPEIKNFVDKIMSSLKSPY